MELKDLLGFIDIGEVKDIEDFKEKFKEKFIVKSQAFDDEEVRKAVTGKVAGSLTTLAKKHFGLTPEEIKDKKWEEIIEFAAQKKNSEIEEYKGKAGQTNDEALKEIQAKYEKALNTNKEYKEALTAKEQDFQAKEQDWQKKFKDIKINTILSSAKEKVTPKLKELSKPEKFYFDSIISENIKIDFDEQENPIVLNKEGKRFQNPNKAGSFLALEEAIELLANQENLIKKNNGGPVNPLVFQQQQQQPPQGNERKPHPNAIAHAEKLAQLTQKG